MIDEPHECSDNNGGCSHLCLPLPTRTVCGCPDDRRMENNMTCTNGNSYGECEICMSYYILLLASAMHYVKTNSISMMNCRITLEWTRIDMAGI